MKEKNTESERERDKEFLMIRLFENEEAHSMKQIGFGYGIHYLSCILCWVHQNLRIKLNSTMRYHHVNQWPIAYSEG